MKALLVILLVLVLLGLLKVGIHFTWDGGAKVQLLIWKLRISLPKEKKPKKESKEKTPSKPEQPQKTAVQGWPQAALAHGQDILTLLGKVLHTPRLDTLILHVTAGGPDAAACAMHYGRIWAVLGGILPVLENTFRIGTRDVGVRCDYEQTKISCFAQVDLTVRVYEILVLGILGLKLFLQIYQAHKTTQKAVQST